MQVRELAELRLRSHRLSGAPAETAEDVVRWLGAVQSQEYAVAKWSIAQRATGVSDGALDRALAAGRILRTHVLRPTWHFVLPADIRWMIELTGPRVQALNAYWYRKFGLDGATFARSHAVFAQALAGGRQLTRPELASLLGEHGIVADGLRLGYILMRAELDLVVCSGALRGKRHTYALFDDRVPKAKSLARDEALAELTSRYFTSHGPATVKDYVWWSSLTAADARRGVEMVEPALERVVVADRTYWFAAASPAPAAVSPVVHLLQGYDEYVVAYTESKGVLNVAGLAGVVPHGAATFTHAIVLDGQVIGHWRRALTGKAVTIEVQLARPLDEAERDALGAAVDRYGEFAGRPASWRW